MFALTSHPHPAIQFHQSIIVLAQIELCFYEGTPFLADLKLNSIVDECVIAEPIRGIVLSSYRELGDIMNYGGELQAGDGATDIAGLADTDDMRAEVDINEANTARSERWLHSYRMPTQISDSTPLWSKSIQSKQPFPEKAYIDMVSVVHDLAAVSSAKLERSGKRLHLPLQQNQRTVLPGLG